MTDMQVGNATEHLSARLTANCTDNQQKNSKVSKNKSQVCNLLSEDLYVLIS